MGRARVMSARRGWAKNWSTLLSMASGALKALLYQRLGFRPTASSNWEIFLVGFAAAVKSFL
jgi:hypothetical protein